MTKTCLALAAFLLAISSAHGAQPAAPRTLASFVVESAGGDSLSTAALRMPRNWVLVVLDPQLPSTEGLLAALTAKDTVWDGRVSVLFVGDATGVLASHPELAAVRVLTSANASIITTLHIPGVPAVLGIRANQEVAWVRSGVPVAPERLPELISGWIGADAAQ